MGVLQRIAERFGLLQPAKGTIARIVDRGLVNRPLPPIWDVRRYADEGYRRNVLIYACVKLRGKSAAQVKLVAKAPNQNGDLEPLADTHPLQKLLAKPNAEQSQREWIKKAFLHLDVGGNVFVHKVRSGMGRIVELWLLRPDKVAVIPDEMGFVQGYEFPTDQKQLVPRVGTLPSKDIVHFKDDDYLDDYYGLSKIAVLARQGDIDNESSEYMRSVLLNSGMPAAGLKVKSEVPIPREAKEALQQEWRDKYGRRRTIPSWLGMNEFTAPNAGGWGDLAIFDADVEWIKMGSAFNDMDLNGIFQHTETRITMAFGVPAMLVGAKAGIDRSTYSNSEQAEDNFWNQTMVPEVNDFCEKLTAEVAPEFGNGIIIEGDFSQVRALQEDQDKRADRAGKGWDRGVITFDEYRIALGEEAIGEEALLLDETTGQEIAELGMKFKWQLPQAKAALNGNANANGNGAKPNQLGPGDPKKGTPQLEPGDEGYDPALDPEMQRYFRPRRLMLAAGKKPAWKRLHQAADDKSLSIRRCVSKGFRLAKEGVEIQALANSLFVKDSMKAEALALTAFRENGVPIIRKTMCSALGSLYRAGARAGVKDMRGKQATGPGEKLAGPEIDPGADAGFAETRVGELITDVTEATRSTIRRFVEGMFEEGYSARRAATRIRDTIGLTKQGLARLEKWETKQVARGITGEALDASLSRFSRKLIRERALTIARTEGIRAVSEGQSSIWEKAVEGGILPQDQEQFWIVTEDSRTCPICLPMDGQTVKVGESFSAGDGSTVYAPPAHVQCRCARGLR